MILSAALLGWTYVNAVVGMVFYSISLAFGPISMITSIGMLLPSDYIGTGLGMYKSSNNIGTSILDIVVGVVQDNTENQAYTGELIGMRLSYNLCCADKFFYRCHGVVHRLVSSWIHSHIGALVDATCLPQQLARGWT
jgi:hypothetical protein